MKKLSKKAKEKVEKQMKTSETTGTKTIALEKMLRGKEAELRKLKEQRGKQEIFIEGVISAMIAAKPYPKYKYQLVVKKTEVFATLKLSDWQIGEVVPAAATERFGEFNLEIAKRRLTTIIEDFIKWVNVQRKVYKIDECHLLLEGDFVSGDVLHEDLTITNEFPLPVQTAEASLLMGEIFLILCSHFKRVVAWENPVDNHGRLTKSVPAKNAGLNNINYVLYAMANEKASRCNNLTIHTTEGAKLLANIGGYRFLSSHGNEIRSWMGIPYYGMERMAGREARKRMGTHAEFDFISIGHYHVDAVIAGTMLVNGCLTGTTELDHMNGRYARPNQVAFLVGKRGFFNWTPFRGEK